MAKFRSFSSLLIIPKRFFSTSEVSSGLPFTVHYFVNTCGIPLESAISAARKVQIRKNATKKTDAVLSCLKGYGFNDTHLASLIARRPKLILCRPHIALKPKLDFFIECGFHGSLLHEFILNNPEVLERNVKTFLEPIVNFLRTYIPTFQELNAAIRRSGRILICRHALMRNTEFLLREGVARDRVSRLIIYQPRTAVHSPKRMVKVVKNVKQIGLEPKSCKFIEAVRIMLSMSEANWNHKVEFLKSLGWSEEDVLSVFKKDPICLSVSKDKFRSLMDFYLNTMKMDLEVIVKNPKFLHFALTRLHQRHRVLEYLISKGLIKRDKSNCWLLYKTEDKFLRMYVVKNLDKVPDLMEIYRGSSHRENGEEDEEETGEECLIVANGIILKRERKPLWDINFFMCGSCKATLGDSLVEELVLGLSCKMQFHNS